EANADRVRLGKRLVTIRKDVDVQLELERSRWTRYDAEKVRRLFDDLEFRQLLPRFPLPDSVTIPVQPTLAFEPVAPDSDVRVIADAAGAKELGLKLHSAPEVGLFPLWDRGPRDGKLVGLGLSLDGESFYVPFGHHSGEPRLEADLMVDEVLASLPGS